MLRQIVWQCVTIILLVHFWSLPKQQTKPRSGRVFYWREIMTRKGQHHSAESREKMRLSHLGKPSNNKGKKLSEEQVDKMRQRMLGKPSPMKGKKQSPSARLKMSLAKRGKPSQMLGKHHTEETK